VKLDPRAAQVFAVALAGRLAVVAWAASRFPPAGDGTYYEALGRRIADGLGATWAWPDGVVTYAAHYPVGYPALVAGAYLLAGGAKAWAPMLVNAALGAAGAAAVYALLERAVAPRWARAGALATALHPALVLYTPALMTEGVTSALLTIALACAARASRLALPGSGGAPSARLAAGLALGVATLVRPQSIVLAPLFGGLAGRGARGRALAALVVTCVALACCAPWTARNCARMGRCALVSVNGGWNLLIGVQSESGAWAPLDAPAGCRDVWGEADKDACFGRYARARIAAAPAAFVARAPRKLAVTFDYFGAAPWYLHASNPGAFDARAKVAAGALETGVSRLFLLGALVAAARLPGPRRRARFVIVALVMPFGFLEHAWPSYLGLAGALCALGPRALGAVPVLVPGTAAVILSTAATHATFFGAGRYGLVVAPFVAALAALASGPPARHVGGVDARKAIAGPAQAGREESPSSVECDAG